MKPEPKSIFRERARQLYLQHQQKLVVLRLVQPKLFPFFWAFLAALLFLAGLAWNTRVPILLSGSGLVLEDPVAGTARIVSLLPPETLARVSPGQRLTVRERGKRQRPLMVLAVGTVAAEVLSPNAIRQAFELDAALGSEVKGPAVVIVSRIDAASGPGADFHRYAGSSLPIEVEVGTQRVLRLVPGLRSWIGEG